MRDYVYINVVLNIDSNQKHFDLKKELRKKSNQAFTQFITDLLQIYSTKQLHGWMSDFLMHSPLDLLEIADYSSPYIHKIHTSLRFDANSVFYRDFILNFKDRNMLADLIETLLKAYAYHPKFRKDVDDLLTAKRFAPIRGLYHV
jgi:hypothetical protein